MRDHYDGRFTADIGWKGEVTYELLHTSPSAFGLGHASSLHPSPHHSSCHHGSTYEKTQHVKFNKEEGVH